MRTKQNTPGWLTLTEVAARAGVSPAVVSYHHRIFRIPKPGRYGYLEADADMIVAYFQRRREANCYGKSS